MIKASNQSPDQAVETTSETEPIQEDSIPVQSDDREGEA